MRKISKNFLNCISLLAFVPPFASIVSCSNNTGNDSNEAKEYNVEFSESDNYEIDAPTVITNEEDYVAVIKCSSGYILDLSNVVITVGSRQLVETKEYKLTFEDETNQYKLVIFAKYITDNIKIDVIPLEIKQVKASFSCPDEMSNFVKIVADNVASPDDDYTLQVNYDEDSNASRYYALDKKNVIVLINNKEVDINKAFKIDNNAGKVTIFKSYIFGEIEIKLSFKRIAYDYAIEINDDKYGSISIDKKGIIATSYNLEFDIYPADGYRLDEENVIVKINGERVTKGTEYTLEINSLKSGAHWFFLEQPFVMGDIDITINFEVKPNEYEVSVNPKSNASYSVEYDQSILYGDDCVITIMCNDVSKNNIDVSFIHLTINDEPIDIQEIGKYYLIEKIDANESNPKFGLKITIKSEYIVGNVTAVLKITLIP